MQTLQQAARKALHLCISIFTNALQVVGLKRRNLEIGTIRKQYIAQFLPDDPVIVEAGAHIGIDSEEMASIWKKGTIYCFEPVPILFQKLRARVAKFPNVKCYQLALGDRSGRSKMHVSSGTSDMSSSLLTPKDHLVFHPDVYFNEEIEVETITLDDWAERENIRRIDFLWLDMQGFELAVLRASQKTISSATAIYTEVALKENYAGGALYPELKKWLESHGFRVEQEKLPWPDEGNVLFLRKNSKDGLQRPVAQTPTN